MAKVRHFPDPICARTRPQFYKVRDKLDPDVWITRSRGHATCPQDGSVVVSVTKDGQTLHLCVHCLGVEKQRVMVATTVEEPGTYQEQKLRCRGPRRVLA